MIAASLGRKPNFNMISAHHDATTLATENGDTKAALSTAKGLLGRKKMNSTSASISATLKMSLANDLLTKKKSIAKGKLSSSPASADTQVRDERSNHNPRPSTSSSLKKLSPSQTSILKRNVTRRSQSITLQNPPDGQYQQHIKPRKSSAGSPFPLRQHHRDDIMMDSDHEESVVSISDARPRAPKRTSSLKKGGSRTASRPLPPRRSGSADQLSRNVVQVRLPGRAGPITRTRSITFDEAVRVKRIPSAADLNDGRADDLWFQSDEYDSIKRKTAALIRAIQQKQTGGVTYCTRGLEKYLNAEEVQHKRHSAYGSVLGEQEMQRRSGSYDDLKLCQAYKRFTHNSTVEAEERGRLDEDAIDRYVKRAKAISRIYSMPNTHSRPASLQ